jgi:hypothetical protein
VIEQHYGGGMWNNYEIVYSSGSRSGWDTTDSSWSIEHNVAWQDFDSLGNLIHVYNNPTPGGYSEYFYNYDLSGNLIYQFSHSESQGGITHEYEIRWLYFSYPDPDITVIAANDTISGCVYENVPLELFVTGGIPPYQYSWSPPASVTNDSILCSTTYLDSSLALTVTVTDSAGTSAMHTIYALMYPLPYFISFNRFPACIGCNNGMFVFTTGGGTGFITYSINPTIPGAVYDNDTISGLPAGIYSICLRDQQSCSVCLTDTIFENGVFVREFNNLEVSFYPNPFTSVIRMRIPEIREI